MQIKRNIFLIGPRACGKTSVGRRLAERLGLDFIDTDHVLVQEAGMEISDYVEQYGWDGFRDRETEVLQKVAEKGVSVIGCGGGVVLREKNRAVLKTGVTLYLKTSPEEIVRRLKVDPNESQRPSLTGKDVVDEVREVLAQRESLYCKCADLILPQVGLEDVVEFAVAELHDFA